MLYLNARKISGVCEFMQIPLWEATHIQEHLSLYVIHSEILYRPNLCGMKEGSKRKNGRGIEERVREKGEEREGERERKEREDEKKGK